MRDLVSYDQKHNEANGEGNRDGDRDNRSWNCGVEGETDDPAVTALRGRQVRNLLTTLLLSTGVPMLVAGDEIARTQGGNNNAYCQDNEMSWLDWSAVDKPAVADLLALTRRLVALRRDSPVLRQRGFFAGRPVPGGDGRKDLAWLRADGTEMTEREWHAPDLRTLGMYLDGDGIRHRGPRGERLTDESYLLVLHAGAEDTHVRAARAAVGERLGGRRRHRLPGRAAAARRRPAGRRARPPADRPLRRPAPRRAHAAGRCSPLATDHHGLHRQRRRGRAPARTAAARSGSAAASGRSARPPARPAARPAARP